MTTDELDTLQPGTVIYLPTIWEVQTWLLAGRIPGRDYYTLTHPPDVDGQISNKRPVYLHALDLKNATLDKPAAWAVVAEGLTERRNWIYQHELQQSL